MLSEEESQDRFEDADENEDGVVTWSEYIADAYGISSSNEDNDVSNEDRVEENKVRYLSETVLCICACTHIVRSSDSSHILLTASIPNHFSLVPICNIS
jgi:hypothetical protein